MSRTAKKSRAPQAPKVRASAPLIAPTGELLDQRVNKWIELRCQRAYTVVGYTPAADLLKDFGAWHEAEFPADPLPSDADFIMSVRTAFKIRMENLPIKAPFDQPQVGLCVNLTLLNPLRSAA